MKPIEQAWVCQIDVTNVCQLSCLYCSRLLPHVRKDQRFTMTLEQFRQAMESLEGWPNRIGIIGGEPILHPQFTELCLILQEYFPKARTGLWTSGGRRWEEFKPLVEQTYGFVAYNPHDPKQMEVCRHQPITVAIKDAVLDPETRAMLIDDCWVQRTWCPTITPKGAFFCEIAAAWDHLTDGPGGYPVEKGWWKRTPDQFRDQVDRYCDNCGMAIPMDRDLIGEGHYKVSPSNLTLFHEHNLRYDPARIVVFDQTFQMDQLKANAQKWYPGNYRGDMVEDTLCGEGKGSTIL